MTIKKSKAVRSLEKITGRRMSFGKMIESIRKADEISQVDLAARMNMSKAHLCDIEKGRRFVSISRAMQFAKELGYSEIQFVSLSIEDQVLEYGLNVKVTLTAA